MSDPRVTIMIQEDLNMKLRNLQAQMIKKNPRQAVSFSKVINIVLQRALKKKNPNEPRGEVSGNGKRITIVIDENIHKKIKINHGNHIIECAKNNCEMPQWSFSKEINRLLRIGFA